MIGHKQPNVYMQGSKGRRDTTPKKRRISAAGRRRIAAAQKARWAKIKAKQARRARA